MTNPERPPGRTPLPEQAPADRSIPRAALPGQAPAPADRGPVPSDRPAGGTRTGIGSGTGTAVDPTAPSPSSAPAPAVPGPAAPADPLPPRATATPAPPTPAPETAGPTPAAAPPATDEGPAVAAPLPAPPPTPSRRLRVARAGCWVLGAALLAGAAAAGWERRAPAVPAAEAQYRRAAALWREEPVDGLFPPELIGQGAGPGGADRRWIRTAVAPDGPCTPLGPVWTAALAPAGCTRLLRASYTDTTRSSTVSVGLVFTPAEPATLAALAPRLETEAPPPAAYGVPDARRASWAVSVLPDAPVVVYAVSAFADGRTVDRPRPAASAMSAGDTSPAGQAGLGHEARAVADRLERALRRTVAEPPTTRTDPAPPLAPVPGGDR
ncbi:hypothetical protein [Streptomyces sp. NPDC097619]|uniref:hypothetical protein n=1 Tax=Streptomyces sp. NPDC097619 TaxID=3157228 RepID=UPI003323924D